MKGQISGTFLLRSSHPHDDALGMGLVVQKDHRRLRLAPTELRKHSRRLFNLLAEARLAEMQGNRILADRHDDRVVALEMHFLNRITLADARAVHVFNDIERSTK